MNKVLYGISIGFIIGLITMHNFYLNQIVKGKEIMFDNKYYNCSEYE